MTTILMTRNYDGLVVSDTPQARGHLALDWSKLCAVKIGHSLVYRGCRASRTIIPNRAARDRMLRRKGYHRIGLALRAAVDEMVNHMYRACYAVETDRPKLFEKIPPLITRNGTKKTFEKWYSRYQPQVVLSLHLKVLNWLSALGRRIPTTWDFVDLDCADRSGVRAGVYQHHERVGAVAVESLVQLMQRNERAYPNAAGDTARGYVDRGATVAQHAGSRQTGQR